MNKQSISPLLTRIQMVLNYAIETYLSAVPVRFPLELVPVPVLLRRRLEARPWV